MAESWGRTSSVKSNQDIVSDPQHHNILKVNDVNEGDDDKIAIKAVNTSTNADARALKVEGVAEIIANVFEQAPGSTGLLVSNASRNPFGRALKVQTPFEGDPPATVTAEVINNSSHQSSRALKVTGRTEINAVDGDNDPSTTALHVINRSDHDDAKALRVEGMTEILAGVGGDPGPIGLRVVNLSANPESRALKLEGLCEMTDPPRGDPEIPCLKVARGGGHPNSRALKVAGMSEMVAQSVGDPESTGLSVTNASNHANALALKVDGTSELNGHVNVDGPLFITGPENGLYAKDNDPLLIGSSVDTGEVIIGGPNNNVRTVSNLRTQNGLDGADGDLNIGATNHTDDVNIGRDGQDVIAKGRLDAEEHIRVGTDAVDGQIDCQANNRDLNIGTQNNTRNVILSRVGQTIDMFGQVQMNGNAILMNNGIDIIDPAARGIIDNPVGHIPGQPSIDFYIQGICVFYIDNIGGHNA